jgi:hypothetical protein
MADVGAYLAQLLLNVALKNTASLLSPGSLGLGLAVQAAPTSIHMSEPGSSIGYAPKAAAFNSVGSAGTKASNTAAITFGAFNTRTTYFGAFLKDTLAVSSLFNSVGRGNILFYGPFSSPTSIVASSGDTIVFAAGALTISMV